MSAPLKPDASWRHWMALLAAILLEVSGTTIMKASHSWEFPYAGYAGLLIMWGCIALSYYSLARAVLVLPVGVAFALWDGFGLVLITLFSLCFMEEVLTPAKAAGLLCVLIGGLLVHRGTDGSHA